MEAIKYKASETFLQVLQNYGKWLGGEGMLFNGIRFREREFITADRIKNQFYSLDQNLTLSNRILLVQEWLLRELVMLERLEREADWVLEELNYLDSDEYVEAYGMLHKEKPVFDVAEKYAARDNGNNSAEQDEGAFDFAEREEELLRQKLVKNMFKPLRKSVRKFQFVDVKGIYEQLFADEAAYRKRTNGAIPRSIGLRYANKPGR